MVWPLLLAAVVSSGARRNELSIALAHCACIVSENKTDSGLALISVVGFRGDYAFHVGGGIRLGASAAVDWLQDKERDQATFGRFGPTLMGRWGRNIQGGIRVGAGYAYGDDGKTGRYGDPRVAATGWYFDSDGEVAGRDRGKCRVVRRYRDPQCSEVPLPRYRVLRRISLGLCRDTASSEPRARRTMAALVTAVTSPEPGLCAQPADPRARSTRTRHRGRRRP